jgi:hypothetical protein
MSWRDDRYLARAASGDAYDDKTRWKPDPEIMNSEDTKIDFSGTFSVSHGPPLFSGLPESTGGAWITGFTRMSRRYYAQYDLRQFPFDRQVRHFAVPARSSARQFLRPTVDCSRLK